MRGIFFVHLPPREGICDNVASVHDWQAIHGFVTIKFEGNGNVDFVIGNGALVVISDTFEESCQWPRDIL